MPTCFVLGQILMICAAPEIAANRDQWITRPMKAALFYAAFVFIPVAAWSFYKHTAWATVYLRPENSIPAWAGPFIFTLYFLGMILGAGLAQTLIQLGRREAVSWTLGLGCFWLAGTAALTSDEYFHVGTYDQYRLGAAATLWRNSAMQWDLAVMGILLALPFLALAIYFWWRSRSL